MNMGEKIFKLRKARGWSQEELAEQLGVTRQAVSRWESGSAKPDADKISALCNTFGISADYLLCTGGTVNVPMTVPVQSMQSGDRSMLQRMIVGIVLITLSVIMFIWLTVVSIQDPWEVLIDGDLYDGIIGYILGHDLQWLAVGVLLLFLVGMTMLLWKYLRMGWNYVMKHLKK